MTPPAYISWTGHGTANGEPPGVFTDAVMHVFGIKTDRQATQALVDKLLKPVAGDRVGYTSITDMALITFMDVAKCTTPTEVIGWVPGRECAIFIPLLESHGLKVIEDRVVLWSPYIFINYCIGLVTGREVWGWPKVMAEIAMPGRQATSAPTFQCSTMIFPKFAVDTQGINAPLITVTGPDPLVIGNPEWNDGRVAARHIVARVAGKLFELVADPLGLDPISPSIVLKQFRDSNSPKLACFQAIVNSPVRFTGFAGGGFHGPGFTAKITTCDSHQIVQDLLGRAPDPGATALPVEFATWLAFDFDAFAGSVVVQSA
jgi:Acetoacetate decarboxylase (ADC)